MLALLLAGRVALGLGQCAAEVQPVEDAAPGFGRERWLALLTGQREAQPVEDPARLLSPRAGHLHDTLAKADAAPLGVFLDRIDLAVVARSEEHTSELQSLMRSSYAVFCLNNTKDQR